MARELRKTKYIDPAVQGALVRRLVLHWLAFTTITTLAVIGLQWFEDPFTSFGNTLRQAWDSYGAVVLILACLAPVFIYDSIKLSSRFTGPIHRLREGLSTMASGQAASTLTFRDDDFWHDLAEDFNRVAERLRGGQPSAATPASNDTTKA